MTGNDPAFVCGFLAVTQDREVDPGEPRAESRAPDDTLDIQDLAVLQHREAVPHTGDPRHTLNAGSDQVLRLHTHERISHAEELGPGLASDRRPNAQDVMPHETHDADEDVPREPRLDPERYVGGLLACHPCRVALDDLQWRCRRRSYQLPR